MTSVELVKRVDEIQETIQQGQDNGTETLRVVKYQVELLKTWIFENCSKTQAGCGQTVCSCDHVACMTCEAERQATASATRWFDNQKPHTLLDLDTKRETDHWDRISHCVKQHEALLYVLCFVDENYHATDLTFKFFIMLHPYVSATGTTITPKNLNACGLIALLFAKIAARTPSERYLFHIHKTTPVSARLTHCGYKFLRNAIKDGNDLYDANCDGKTDVMLDPSSTVLISSHIGVSLAEQIAIDPDTVITSLASSVLQLKEGHILLFFRMEDYKVLSVVNFRGSNNMLLFDGQLHKMVDTDKEIEYGGVICQFFKDYYTILEILTLLEQHCGKFEGVCKAAIVKLDT